MPRFASFSSRTRTLFSLVRMWRLLLLRTILS